MFYESFGELVEKTAQIWTNLGWNGVNLSILPKIEAKNT